MKKEVKNWWISAKRDEETAESLFNLGRYKECSFFCQQAIEKALKALIIKNKKQLIKIHDLVKLSEIAEIGKEHQAACERLTFVYIDARYPDTSTEDYTKSESEEDMKTTFTLLSILETKIEDKKNATKKRSHNNKKL